MQQIIGASAADEGASTEDYSACVTEYGACGPDYGPCAPEYQQTLISHLQDFSQERSLGTVRLRNVLLWYKRRTVGFDHTNSVRRSRLEGSWELGEDDGSLSKLPQIRVPV